MAKDIDLGVLRKNMFEAADRADRWAHATIVLTGVQELNSALEESIKKVICPMSKKKYEEKLFAVYRPLSTLAAKITMARALGLVSSETYDELEKVRAIRNEFAHSDSLENNLERGSIAPIYASLRKHEKHSHRPEVVFLECLNAIVAEMATRTEAEVAHRQQLPFDRA